MYALVYVVSRLRNIAFKPKVIALEVTIGLTVIPKTHAENTTHYDICVTNSALPRNYVDPFRYFDRAQKCNFPFFTDEDFKIREILYSKIANQPPYLRKEKVYSHSYIHITLFNFLYTEWFQKKVCSVFYFLTCKK